MSRQSDYQQRHRVQGLCKQCTNPVYLGGALCERCLLNSRKRNRKRQGVKPWRPGGPGRPPLDSKVLAGDT